MPSFFRLWHVALLAIMLLGASVYITAAEKRSGKRRRRPVPSIRRQTAGNQPRSVPFITVSDEEIDQSIQKSVTYLYSVIQDDGSISSSQNARFPGGADALVLLGYARGGGDLNDPKIKALIKRVASLDSALVYVRAARAMALSALGQKEHLVTIKKDVAWLLTHRKENGGWGYGPGGEKTQKKPLWVDTCNSKFALHALNIAAGAGVEIPSILFKRCHDFWAKRQNPDGGWGYEATPQNAIPLRGTSYGTMTAAGIDALLSLEQKLPPKTVDRKRILDAYNWLKENYTTSKVPMYEWGSEGVSYYMYLYYLSRAVSGAGWRTINGHNAIGEINSTILALQRNDGSSAAKTDAPPAKDDVLCAAYSILTLLHNRPPLLISILKNSRDERGGQSPANLTKWVSKNLNTKMSFQMLPLFHPRQAITEAPILFIRAAKNTMPEMLVEKIKYFLSRGGTVVFQVDESGIARANMFLRKTFPKFKIGKLDPSHPVFNLREKIPANKIPLGLVAGDDVRSRIFVLADDIDSAWKNNLTQECPEAFQFIANLLLYATDMKSPSEKWNSDFPPADNTETPAVSRGIKIARVKHAGRWKACPDSLEKLNHLLSTSMSVSVSEEKPIDLSEPVSADIKMLWLTGMNWPKLSSEQIGNIRKYIKNGGTIFIDPAMGDENFFLNAKKTLSESAENDKLIKLPPGHPLITGKFSGGMGSDLSEVSFSHAVRKEKPKLRTPPLWGIEIDGRTAVILSPYSIICPMEGYPAFGCRGLAPDDAMRLAINILLYTASR